jgi:hypothetical protein
MYPLEDFQVTLERISTILSHLQIPFHLTGGAAAIVLGEPRYTQDIDLVVHQSELKMSLPAFFVAMTENSFLFTNQTVQAAVDSGRMFQILDAEHSLKVDLYPRELVSGELDRSVRVEVVPGIVVPVACRTDTAISKLIWISKGSHKGRRDLRQIMLRASPDEIQTVRAAAKERQLESLLDEVLAEPDEIDA